MAALFLLRAMNSIEKEWKSTRKMLRPRATISGWRGILMLLKRSRIFRIDRITIVPSQLRTRSWWRIEDTPWKTIMRTSSKKGPSWSFMGRTTQNLSSFKTNRTISMILKVILKAERARIIGRGVPMARMIICGFLKDFSRIWISRTVIIITPEPMNLRYKTHSLSRDRARTLPGTLAQRQTSIRSHSRVNSMRTTTRK